MSGGNIISPDNKRLLQEEKKAKTSGSRKKNAQDIPIRTIFSPSFIDRADLIDFLMMSKGPSRCFFIRKERFFHDSCSWQLRWIIDAPLHILQAHNVSSMIDALTLGGTI